MKNRKYILILIIIISHIFLGITFDEYTPNPFSYSVISEVSFVDGNSFRMPEHYKNLFNKQKVKKLTVIDATGNKEKRINTVIYNNGLITSDDYSPSDVRPPGGYEYDTKNRLIKFEFFTIEYSENNSSQLIERRLYCEGEFQKTERIVSTSNGYRIENERSGGSTSEDDFIFENNLIKEVNTFLWGKPSLWYKFEYENGLVKQITGGTDFLGHTWTRTITKREGNNIISMDLIDITKKNPTYTWNFYNYDKYDNWTIAEMIGQNKILLKYVRDIEYID